jgi:hypothetical protein
MSDIIRAPKNLKEIRACVMMYTRVAEDFFKLNIPKAVDALAHRVRTNGFVRLRIKNDEIVGWLSAKPVVLDFSDVKILQQEYFITAPLGYLSYTTTVKLHEAMFEEAVRLEMDEAMSMGNLMSLRGDAVNLARSLEMVGWERRGYVARRRCRDLA